MKRLFGRSKIGRSGAKRQATGRLAESEEVDRMLSIEEEILPSSGFAVAVQGLAKLFVIADETLALLRRPLRHQQHRLVEQL